MTAVARNSAFTRVWLWYQRTVEPTALGLPNWRVMLWFPVLVFLGTVLLTFLHISGTSSGAHWYVLGEGVDPRLIAGTPRTIRSDEWLIYQSLVVAQVQQGFPAISDALPGGVDSSVFNQLPVWDWFAIFRPQTWGYLFLGLDGGVAWGWWLPGAALVSGCYLLFVALLPRRPLTAAIISAAVYFSPIMQWWRTEPPVAWTFLAIAGVVFTLVDSRRWIRIVWAAIIGYVAVVMAMGLYLPFIIPGVYVVVFFAVGFLLERAPWKTKGVRGTLSLLLPLIVAAAATVAVLAIWVAVHWSSFKAVQETVYPGRRTSPTGDLLTQDPFLTSIGSAPWSQALRDNWTGLLGANSSEASSVFLLAVFMLPVLIWWVVRSLRRGRRTEWVLLFCCALILLVLAFLFIPGWDSLSQLLQLDKVGAQRIRIVFLLVLPLLIALTIRYVQQNPSRKNWVAGAVSAGIAGLSIAALAVVFSTKDPETLRFAPTWLLVSVALVACALLFYVPRFAGLAAALLLAGTLVSAGLVNPIYRGVFDLRATATGQAIEKTDAADEGLWVGVGSYEVMALLMQTGVHSMSGFQTYPPEKLWKEIDPDGSDEAAWNRLAHIRWAFAAGEPRMSNPSPDVVTVTFDPCSAFAQTYVQYVLADTASSSSCLRQLDDIDQGSQDMRVFEVVPASKPLP